MEDARGEEKSIRWVDSNLVVRLRTRWHLHGELIMCVFHAHAHCLTYSCQIWHDNKPCEWKCFYVQHLGYSPGNVYCRIPPM